MVGTIITAAIYNLVVLFILISGVFSAVKGGVKVTLIKLFMVLCGGVGAYFLTPIISRKFYGIEGMYTIVYGKISPYTIKSLIFLLWFLLFYAITLMVCNIVKHCLIKKLRSKRLNQLKIKRAKSINPRAERASRKAEWRSLKIKYAEKRRWYHRLLSTFIGLIISVTTGYIVLMPLRYIASDMGKEYLIKGYEYTLNGVTGEKIPEFLIHAKDEVKR